MKNIITGTLGGKRSWLWRYRLPLLISFVILIVIAAAALAGVVVSANATADKYKHTLKDAEYEIKQHTLTYISTLDNLPTDEAGREKSIKNLILLREGIEKKQLPIIPNIWLAKEVSPTYKTEVEAYNTTQSERQKFINALAESEKLAKYNNELTNQLSNPFLSDDITSADSAAKYATAWRNLAGGLSKLKIPNDPSGFNQALASQAKGLSLFCQSLQPLYLKKDQKDINAAQTKIKSKYSAVKKLAESYEALTKTKAENLTTSLKYFSESS